MWENEEFDFQEHYILKSDGHTLWLEHMPKHSYSFM